MTDLRYARTLHHHETDADGVCHFSNYLRIFEEALEHAFEQSGVCASRLDHGLAVVAVNASYVHPLRHGDTFDVQFTFTQVNRSFLQAQALVRLGGKQSATINATLAAINRQTNQSTALDMSLRRTLSQLKKMEVA